MLAEVSVVLVSPFVGVQLSVSLEQSVLAGPSVYLIVMSSSNTPESGAVSKIGPNSRVLSTPVPVVVVSTDDPTVITPLCTTSPPAVANVSESDPLAT